ncbi:transposase [Streptomyces noursei]|uniref:transposase n=1 Tax=Streptomyces noursei TaxID=1971 RepID=UPI0033C47719
MAEKRRKYDAEFREGAVRIVLETGKPAAEVARDLGVHEGTLQTWVHRAKVRADAEARWAGRVRARGTAAAAGGECPALADSDRRASGCGGLAISPILRRVRTVQQGVDGSARCLWRSPWSTWRL